ncbi:aminotransferase class I/II-fold pyridoxal phosphate-dependent enzyme [Variovorax sp. ZT4R33]|uniref:aminotransferase class I/II-fold pyridoxal phosphate-dependent enzyme n=1 Tax=Variovorax sp. ZT4R33 TaxID=3443743 RepID=UPI003F48D0E4
MASSYPRRVATIPSSTFSSDAVHGGPDALGVPLHDFSTNGNGCGPCPVALAALQTVDAAHYPDPQYTALRETLARFHGVDPQRIVIAASASEFIFRITAAFASCGGRHVALPPHSYGDYRRAARAWGLTAVTWSEDGWAGGPAPSLHWACDPSSPLGQAEPGLGARIDRLPEGAACVLDLAYEPLRLEAALALTAAHRDRVWQLVTPNKALGLTGIRAAYAIAPRSERALRNAVAQLAPSWPVGGHGVALLAAWTSPDAQAHLAGSRATLVDWKTRQIAVCESLGWVCLPSVANFFCVRPGVASLPALVAGLRGHGVKVREAASFGLPEALRLAVLSPASQEALRAAVQALAAR